MAASVYKGRSTQQSICGERFKNQPLGTYFRVSRDWTLLLESIQQQMQRKTFCNKYSSVFHGLGDEYEVKLKPDAKPCTPISMCRFHCVQRSNRNWTMEVISKVDEPEWWLCQRSQAHYGYAWIWSLWTATFFGKYITQLAGAKVFSKLHANSGFWQIPLAKLSRLYLQPSSPLLGSIVFGISSAPEHFHKIMSKCQRS